MTPTLSHLNFGEINHLARQGIVRGISKLKFEKDHLCSACAMGKSKKKSHTPKSEDTNQEKLYLLHMDLCGPMRVASVNGKKYILVIVDDYSRFTWVKFLRSKDEALDFIIKFLNMIQVRLKVPVQRIRIDNGTEFVNQTLREYYEKVGISHETSVARSPQQNGVVERRNRMLIEAIRTMLIYAKALVFLWAEAVATAYFDELTAMASEHSSSRPALHEMTPATISSGLVPNPPLSKPFIPPSRTDWDLLFQSMFDELLTPSPSVDCPAPKVIAPIDEVVAPVPAVSTGSPSSTIVNQYAPSPSNSQTTSKTQSPIIPNDVEEYNHDLDITHMNNDPFFGIPILENESEASSSLDVTSTVMQTAALNSEHVTKWTKDHHLDNIIGELQSPVSTRLQLYEQALFCYYDAFLTSVEPKNYKDALTQACWIKAMQEELHEFDRLEVWNCRSHIIHKKTRQRSYPAYAYADHAGCQDTRRSTSGCMQLLGDRLVSWSSKRQKSDAISSTEAEYIAMSGCCSQILWMRSQLTDYGLGLNKISEGIVNWVLWYPKDSSIALTTFADVDHAGCQDTHRSTSDSMQFLGDRLVSWSSKRQKSVTMSSTEAEYIAMDIFTKPICRERIEFLTSKLRMRSFTPETLKKLADEVEE
ncbi:retrovirus-related pol polyprotein from transposon TNT 1-94 [Tanacetum coccineum]